uniref:Uncharacterized protein n=1 Tax=Rhizophora mucronata TaxID=61149 RepID=A0A2P2QEH3_RHIMU
MQLSLAKRTNLLKESSLIDQPQVVGLFIATMFCESFLFSSRICAK